MIKKLLYVGLFGLACSNVQSQTVLFNDDFESYSNFQRTSIGDWTMRDVDGKNTFSVEVGEDYTPVTFPGVEGAGSFFVFNPTATSPALYTAGSADNGYVAHSGSKYLVSIGATNAAASAEQTNDWMISPRLALGASSNVLTFYSKGLTNDYSGGERYAVYVSTTNTEVASFTKISQGNYIVAPIEWTLNTYNLDAYANQNIYVAIRSLSVDEFIFMVDDFKVTTATLSTNDFASTHFNIYPNPATDVINISSKTGIEVNGVKIIDLNGRIVKTAGNVTSLSVGDLSVGVYMVQIETNSGTATTKIVKK